MLGLAVGCKKHSSPSTTGKDTGLTGNFKVSGSITTRTYPCWPCLDSVQPTIVTVPFDTTIQVAHVNSDTFRFYGLGVRMETEDGPNCQYGPDECGFFAIGTGDSLNFIKVIDPAGELTGGARITGDSVYFTYNQFWRNTTWYYGLSGRRQ